MNTRESSQKPLRVVLLVLGVWFSLSLVMVFLPKSVIQALAGVWVDKDVFARMWPQNVPLFDYFFKVALVGFFWIGVTFLMAAKDPVKYRGLAILGIVGLLMMGLACLFIGHATGIPIGWYVGKGLTFLVLGALLWIFLIRSR